MWYEPLRFARWVALMSPPLSSLSNFPLLQPTPGEREKGRNSGTTEFPAEGGRAGNIRAAKAHIEVNFDNLSAKICCILEKSSYETRLQSSKVVLSWPARLRTCLGHLKYVIKISSTIQRRKHLKCIVIWNSNNKRIHLYPISLAPKPCSAFLAQCSPSPPALRFETVIPDLLLSASSALDLFFSWQVTFFYLDFLIVALLVLQRTTTTMKPLSLLLLLLLVSVSSASNFLGCGGYFRVGKGKISKELSRRGDALQSHAFFTT